MSKQTLLNGGVQYIPQIASVDQIIYLDFDGELTSYHNEDLVLDIDGVLVEDSGLTEERIQQITAALNEQFAGQNVRFVSDLSDLSDLSNYSTIYIGKTSSFAPYGNFAGLAETVDSGNQKKNDNAFVILDSTSDNAKIIETIAHETGHLLGTLDHGGDGLEKYAARYDVSSGVTSTGKVLDNDSMYISSDGTANSTSVNHSGYLYVSSGGTANSTTINDGGRMYVSSGATANSTTVNSGGDLHVFSGGSANNTTVNYYSGMYVHSGGIANSTTVNDCGWLDVSSGGMANSTTVNSGGDLHVSSGGTANNTTVNSYGWMWVSSEGTALAIKENGGYVYVYDDNEANVSFVSNSFSGLNLRYQCATLHSGTTANTTTVNSDAKLYVSSGGTANSTTVNFGGSVYVSSGGIANSTTVNSGGELLISSGGTATNIVWTPCIGRIYAYEGASVTYASTYSGVYFGNGSLISSAMEMSQKILDGGSMYVMNGGIANTTTVNYGWMYVHSAGIANNTTVNSNGFMYVSSGGTANSVLVKSEGVMHVCSDGTANSVQVKSGGFLSIYSGGTALAIKEKGGYVGIENEANVSFVSNSFSELNLSNQRATLHSGTTANSTMVGSNGNLFVYDGGTANSTWVKYCGSMDVSSGGTANTTTVTSSGRLYVSSGGMANSTTVIKKGSMFVNNSGTANNTTVNNSGYLYVANGGIANNTTLKEGGRMYLSSGGIANNTTVNSRGCVYISSGGIVSGTLQIDDWFTLVSAYQGAIIDFTIAEQTTPNTALINDWSRILGGDNATYTITVNSNQSKGTYILAKGAADFEKSVTVKNTAGIELGTIFVEGSLVDGEKTYFLEQTGDELIFRVQNAVYSTITITADSANKKYDGTELKADGFTYSGTLAQGDKLVVTVAGSITDAGTAVNKVTSYKVMNGETDVTDNYAFNASIDGVLNVTQRNVTLTSNSDSRKYNGEALEGTVTINGDGFVDGEATASASSITDAGSVTNIITVNEGAGYKASNYNITKNEGTLEVTKRQVTLTSADDTKVYDGKALTNDTITVSGDGFVKDEWYTADVTGTQTEIGSSSNTFTYELTNGATTQNYDVTKVEGTLEVTDDPYNLTVNNRTLTIDDTRNLETLTFIENGILDVSNGKIAAGTLTVTGKGNQIIGDTVSAKTVVLESDGEIAVEADQFEKLVSAKTLLAGGLFKVTDTADQDTLKSFEKVQNLNVEFDLIQDVKKADFSYSRNLTFDGLHGTTGNDTLTIGKDAIVTLSGLIDLEAGKNTFTIKSNAKATVNGSVKNVSTITVDAGGTIKSGSTKYQEWTNVQMQDVGFSTSGGTLSIGKFAEVTVDGDVTGGINKITLGSNSSLTAKSLEDINNLTLSAGSKYKEASTETEQTQGITQIKADSVKGTYKKDTFSFGNYTNVQIKAVDLGDEADTISIGADSELNITEKLSMGDEANILSIGARTTANIASLEGRFSKLTLANGSSEEQTCLDVASGTIWGVDGKTSTITVGNYALLKAGMIDLSSGNNKISVGANSILNAESIALNSGTNTFTIGKQSEVTTGNLTGATTLTLAAGTEEQQTELHVENAIASKGKTMSITLGNYSIFEVKELSGTDGNDKLNVGAESVLTAGSIDLDKGTNTFSIGKHSEATVNGDVKNVTTLTLTAGTKDKYGIIDSTKLNVTGSITGTNGKNNTLTLGNYSEMKAGNIAFYTGKDKVSIGTEAGFTAGDIDFGTGTDTMTIGSRSSAEVGNIKNVNKLTLSNGTYDKKSKETSWTQLSAGEITGTSGNDTFTFGNYCDADLKSIQFAAGNDTLKIGNYSNVNISGNINFTSGKNTVQIGNDSDAVLKSENASAVTKFTIGKNSKVYLSSELFKAVTKADKTAQVFDIGSFDVAKNFTSFADETADNDEARDLTASYDGWLNNTLDEVDYLKNQSGSNITLYLGNEFKISVGGSDWKTAAATEVIASGVTVGIMLNDNITGSYAYKAMLA